MTSTVRLVGGVDQRGIGRGEDDLDSEVPMTTFVGTCGRSAPHHDEATADP
jgi:hypothetical protein